MLRPTKAHNEHSPLTLLKLESGGYYTLLELTLTKKINLRVLYPGYYTKDYFIEVPDQLAQELLQFQRKEDAYHLRTYRNKAYYSLDRGDGIENHVLFTAATPDELYEKKLTNQQLHAAICQLPEKQAKRIYAYYFLDMDEPTIARTEGVSHQAVHSSIQHGLKRIEKILKNSF